MRVFLLLLLQLLAWPAVAALNVFATVPEWAALAKEIGGDKVTVYAATHALQDPHRIEARPSLLAQARRANLVIATGVDLEAGWLPLVVRDSGNATIQPGQSGYFEAASVVSRLEVPQVLDRSHGDLHAGGNPHIQLDPYRVLKVAVALAERLATVDTANAAHYRSNYRSFADKWQAAIPRWETQAKALRGLPVVVQHGSFSYLFAWLGIKVVAVLEPKPGIEPSSGHLSSVLANLQQNPARLVIRAAYQQEGPGQWIANKAKLPLVVLPFTVGGSAEAKDLHGLFDDTIQRLLQGMTP